MLDIACNSPLKHLGRRLSESFFGWAWVREAMQSDPRRATRDIASPFESRAVTAVEVFREELIRVAAVEAGAPQIARRAIDANAIQRTIDKELLGVRVRRLIATAEQWHQAYLQARTQDDDLAAFMRGSRYWPLIPSEYVTNDGSRRIVPLVNSQAVMEHGKAMSICLAGSHLAAYDAACRKGRVFLLAMLDAASGARLSTAEFKATRHAAGRKITVTLVQHTSQGNHAPSSACRQALHELGGVISSEPIQRHLRLGLTAMSTFRERRVEAVDRADLLAKIRAFRQTLGHEHYESLVRKLLLHRDLQLEGHGRNTHTTAGQSRASSERVLIGERAPPARRPA